MNRKGIIITILTGILTIIFITPNSWAGCRRQHCSQARMEGVAIGIGAMILAKAIVDHHRQHASNVTPVRCNYSYQRAYYKPAGYWETQRVWVPAKYKKVWNPGHYKRSGRWVPGRWIRIKVRPGHWTSRRIWVPYH
jgi:hypothetical protein